MCRRKAKNGYLKFFKTCPNSPHLIDCPHYIHHKIGGRKSKSEDILVSISDKHLKNTLKDTYNVATKGNKAKTRSTCKKSVSKRKNINDGKENINEIANTDSIVDSTLSSSRTKEPPIYKKVLMI